MASYVEDRIQRSFYMVRMSALPPAPLEGTPEAIGKADYLETVIQDITSMLGITSGLWQACELRPWGHVWLQKSAAPNCWVVKLLQDVSPCLASV